MIASSSPSSEPVCFIEEAEEDIERGDYVDNMDFANQLLAKREAASQ